MPVRARAPALPLNCADTAPQQALPPGGHEASAAWAALAPAVAGGALTAGRVRVSRDGGRTYPRSRERALTERVPDQPAAVRLYDTDGYARCLVADLDVKRGGQSQVDQDLLRLRELVARCGGRAFTDSSPTGGRHLYLPLAQPVHYEQMRAVVRALAALLPSLDPAPLLGLTDGCVRPPGARHRTGGWQRLDGPLPAAQAVAERPNAPAAWSRLVQALQPQLRAQQPAGGDVRLALAPEAAGAAGPKERQAKQAPAVRTGGARPLRPAVLQTARTGAFDRSRYGSPSEARQSVLAAAAASGWHFDDVLDQLEHGAWPGLWAFYARYHDRHRREALAGDWLSALAYAGKNQPDPEQGSGHVRNPDTREPQHTAPQVAPSLSATTATILPLQALGSPLPTDGYAFLRAWWTAVRHAEQDRYVGRAGQSRRLVLRALAAAGQKTGRRHLAFGVRSLAIATGLSRTTVGQELRALRDEDDPLITLLVGGRGLLGDLYELRIPDRYLEQARTEAWRPGRIDALLPCFRVLGVPSALLYEVLDDQPQTSWDLASVALLATRTTQQALAELAAHGLATRDVYGWCRGPADPAAVGRALGADQLVAEQVRRYQAERRAWRERLGTHPGPSIEELRTAPTAPHEPDPISDELSSWLPRQPQPPPEAPAPYQAQDRLPHDAALQLVLRVLGGEVLYLAAR